MCGIAGRVPLAGEATAPAERRAAVAAMIASLRHRGPDHQAVTELPGGACLGHARLSIIDLSPLGHQPMLDGSGRYCITFNGEIYNYRALRRELEGEVDFRGHSDTEVALAAFARWGSAAFDRFDGMFALAIWDAQARELHLARDRFGEKPLFYTQAGGELAFASEVTALLRDPRIAGQLTVSPAAVNHFLSLGYILHPRTLYREVLALPPASHLLLRAGRLDGPHCYWDYRGCFDRPAAARSPQALADELAARLEHSVRSRLESDVPVGCFLSGGLDSSAVVALTRRQVSGELHTFTVRFDEASYDESPDARRVAEHFGTRHHEDRVPGPYAARVDRAVDLYDQPLSDTSLVPMVAVAEVAARQVKVVLSGDGADEIFAGYPTYRADRLHARLARVVPLPLRRALAAGLVRLPAGAKKTGLRFRLSQFGRGLAEDAAAAHYAWRELHSLAERVALLGRHHEEEVRASDPALVFAAHDRDCHGLDPLSRALYVDAKTWLVDDILVKVDRAAMAVSLESRTPYLARDLVEFAATLPAALKLHGAEGKHLLRRALSRVLPAPTLEKAKAGFNAPINRWLDNRSGENEFRFFNRYVAARRGLLPSVTDAAASEQPAARRLAR